MTRMTRASLYILALAVLLAALVLLTRAMDAQSARIKFVYVEVAKARAALIDHQLVLPDGSRMVAVAASCRGDGPRRGTLGKPRYAAFRCLLATDDFEVYWVLVYRSTTGFHVLTAEVE